MALAAAVVYGGGVDLEPALNGSWNLDLEARHLFLGLEGVDQGGQFVQAKDFNDGPAPDVGGDAEEIGESPVGELDAAVLVQQEQALDHAFENDLLVVLKPGDGLRRLALHDCEPTA